MFCFLFGHKLQHIHTETRVNTFIYPYTQRITTTSFCNRCGKTIVTIKKMKV